jgi:glucosamine--fructose-6-phosphate aminotransferase (isomerizing)
VAITNEPDSPLAEVADVVLDLDAGEERAVAATKTYTAQLAVVALISAAMSGTPETVTGLGALASATLAMEARASGIADDFTAMEHTAVLGRGVNHATAFEWALKLQELTHVVAQPFSTADFLHGPIAVIEPGYPVLAVAATGPAADDVLHVLQRCEQAGASLTVIGNDPRVAELTGTHLAFGGDVAEWLSPIPSIIIGQLLAYHLTLAKGLDPDSPRGLGKITRTT